MLPVFNAFEIPVFVFCADLVNATACLCPSYLAPSTAPRPTHFSLSLPVVRSARTDASRWRIFHLRLIYNGLPTGSTFYYLYEFIQRINVSSTWPVATSLFRSNGTMGIIKVRKNSPVFYRREPSRSSRREIIRERVASGSIVVQERQCVKRSIVGERRSRRVHLDRIIIRD